MTKTEWLRKDRQHVWHPFTQMKDYAERDHLLIDRAEGIFLYDVDGNRYYDTNSSWWVNIHGHGHPRIRKAMADQMAIADHVMFSGVTHRPGIELAERLVQITPDGLNKVFYSDNGSTAVEVALKMSFQYWQQTGRKDKIKFMYMQNSYHGDTLGAVSVGGVELYHSLFKPLLFNGYQVPSPNIHEWPDQSPEGAKACVQHAIDSVRQILQADSASIAAIIVEPMIQAAGGMIIYPADYLVAVRALCDEFSIHMIADEVAVGFGRTGVMFACEHARISPDILCLSKGLTAGVIPLAATLCTDEIYMAFYDDYSALKTFFHGHSFTGNPVAAAVALESLNMFHDQSVICHVQETAGYLKLMMERFDASPHLDNIRQLGMVAAMDLFADKTKRIRFPAEQRMGMQVYYEGLQQGLMLRPLGDTVYYWLPLCTTPEQIKDIAGRTERVLLRLELM
jgi:adenosylmethionine-8-amino-7-oxononanoate aminotransferase